MNPTQRTCDVERLEAYLHGRLDERHEREVETHIESCESCRYRMEQYAAEPASWEEATDLLGDPRWRNEEYQAALTNRQPTDSQSNHRQIKSVIESLAPTDDPAMLGRIDGYEISGVIGCGGMGAVLKGFDRSLNRIVAIKVMAPHLASSGAARLRFAREAKAAAAMTHDNVIDIYGVSEANGLPYLVMPYARGPSLQKRIDDCGPLPIVEVLRIGSQIAAGLAAAHAQGLVHRDIKPANILLNDGVERLVITDFGLARAVDDASVTRTGVIAGTPQYMSPEQARGETVDCRSDLFSLGSVMYTLCVGRPPFRAESAYGILRRITDNDPRPIREANPDIPDWLCSIIDRLMSKNPENRFATAEEVAELLEQCLAHVQQPMAVPLPASLLPMPRRKRLISISRGSIGAITMIAALGLILFAGLFSMTSAPPDIAGVWGDEKWGQVVLKQKDANEYDGTFTARVQEISDPVNNDRNFSGEFHLKWSRLERRFNGTWQAGDGSGRISLRLVDREIRGALTTSKGERGELQTPRLGDFRWTRPCLRAIVRLLSA